MPLYIAAGIGFPLVSTCLGAAYLLSDDLEITNNSLKDLDQINILDQEILETIQQENASYKTLIEPQNIKNGIYGALLAFSYLSAAKFLF